jgi:hypothetical protein
MPGDIHDVFEAGGRSQFLENLNPIDNERAYLCFNNEEWLTNEIRAPIPLVPKPISMQQGTISSTSPQLVSMNRSSGLLGKKKRKQFDEDRREKVKKVRKLGACLRCRIYKLWVSATSIRKLLHN